MLSKSRRLNLKTDFKWVSSGKRVETKYLKLFVKFAGNKEAKVGIVTSSKIFDKASERNRARRLVSAAFEGFYSQLPGNINIIALPKAGVVGVKSSDVILDLLSNLSYLRDLSNL